MELWGLFSGRAYIRGGRITIKTALDSLLHQVRAAKTNKQTNKQNKQKNNNNNNNNLKQLKQSMRLHSGRGGGAAYYRKDPGVYVCDLGTHIYFVKGICHGGFGRFLAQTMILKLVLANFIHSGPGCSKHG